MPGIEFVGADAESDGSDDLLDTGPRRPWPRWVWVVAGLLVLAGVVGVLVSSHSDDVPDAAVSTPPPATTTASAPPSAPPSGPKVSVLAADGASLYWLAGARLYRAGPVGRPPISTAIMATGDGSGELQLVPDPAEQVIWVVSHGAGGSVPVPGVVEGFAVADLSRVARVPATSPISGASVLDGALYLLAGGRLLRTTAHASALTLVASVDRAARGLVTAGGGLLYVQGGNGGAIGRWSPSGVRRPAVLETVGNTLAVAGSTVFVLGATRDLVPELDTLSPLSRTVDQRALATGLDGPLFLVAAGARSVIVQGVGRRGAELACVTTADPVDAPGPAKVQALAVSTSSAVAVLRGQVFQADGDSVRPVTFNVGRCST